MPDRPALDGDAVDTRRYAAAIRRQLPLIGAVTVGLAALVFAVSLFLPQRYLATAIVGFPASATSGSAVDQERVINTEQQLVTTTRVLETARQELGKQGIRLTQEDLDEDITAQSVINANLLTITAVADGAEASAQIANAVADAYVEQTTGTTESALTSQIEDLQQLLDRTESTETRLQLQTNLADLLAQQAQQQRSVVVARAANVPESPSSPKPVRNTVLALFVGVFLGVLVALLRDQLRPRFSSPRELGRFLDVPVLSTVPEIGRRLLTRSAPNSLRVEQEAYQSLAAAVRLSLPPSGRHVVLVTSSVHAEGKTTVCSRLARLLAASGQPTLLVSGDLRWPRLDSLLGTEGRPGLSDLLSAQLQGGVRREQLRQVILRGDANDRTAGGADVLPSGTLTGEAARLLSSGAVEPVFDAIRELGYSYVLVDGTPLLGLADAKLLARGADSVMAVARLERLSMSAALDLRDELERLPAERLGITVIGGQTEASPYYSGVKFVAAEQGAPSSAHRPAARSGS